MSKMNAQEQALYDAGYKNGFEAGEIERARWVRRVKKLEERLDIIQKIAAGGLVEWLKLPEF